jgi:hypothetical protein
MERSQRTSEQKPYSSPQLVTYGDVREITRTAGMTTGADDGGKGFDKTGTP